jgi:hypothetical protein
MAGRLGEKTAAGPLKVLHKFQSGTLSTDSLKEKRYELEESGLDGDAGAGGGCGGGAVSGSASSSGE